MKRNNYGGIIAPSQLHFCRPAENSYDADLYAEAQCMIARAVKTKKLPAAYDTLEWSGSRRRRYLDGDALHHEIYDISEDARQVLVCCRTTEGGRYGVRTTGKTYYLVAAHGRGVRVTEANKAVAAKAAKAAGDDNYGDAIAVCQGRKKLFIAAVTPRPAWKIVAIDDTGRYISVYDKSPWDLGVTRRERSSMNHASGYYVFPTIASALAAWRERLVFADEWMTEKRYALVRCDVRGRTYTHNNAKMCVSTVTPVACVASLLEAVCE